MTTTVPTLPATGNLPADLAAARRLAALGVPVFVAPLDAGGTPKRSGWPGLPPGTDETSAWRPGLGLCALMGHVFDVYDIDPRNGGDVSHEAVRAELADDAPRIYARTSTPSGGWHLWISALGIGKHTNWRPGLDLQGAKADGTGRGLVFLPPTVRPSKQDGVMRPYRWIEAPSAAPAGDVSGATLAALIAGAVGARHGAPPRRQVRAVPPVRCTAISAPYVRAALAAELGRVAAAANGERNNVLNSAAFAVGRFVAGGQLDGQAAEDALTGAAGHAGLAEDEARRTIRSAFTARGIAA